MNNIHQQKIAALVSEEHWTWAAYVLHVLGLFTLVTSIAGLIINYVKAGGSIEPKIDTHHRGMIRLFWIFSLLALLAFAIVMIGVVGVALSVVQGATEAGLRDLDELVRLLVDSLMQNRGVLAAAAIAGVLAVLSWVWALFRLLVGMIRLAADKAY